MDNKPDWRKFEELVARIENAAALHGALVKSPDRIRDLVTGVLREVDASIRFRVGTVDVLITVECRKRSRKADDTWIEQLAMKRIKIGAAKTIAVSSKGFSESARLTAANHGIEIRTLEEVTVTDIESWFLSGGAVHMFREVENVQCVVFLRDNNDQPEERGLKIPDPNVPIFVHDKIQSPFPVVVLFQVLENMDPEAFWSIPLDGTKTKLSFTMNFPPNDLAMGTEHGLRFVHHAHISALVSYQSKAFSVTDGKHHVYESADGQTVQHTSFETEMFGVPIRFDHQSDSDGKQIASAEFKPKSQSNKS